MKNKMELCILKIIEDKFDIDEYLKFYLYVRDNMEHPEWLGVLSKDDIEFMLCNGSHIWIWFYKDEFVCSIMAIPSRQKDIIKFGFNFDYNVVIDYGPMIVNPKFVGNGLQYQMLLFLDNYAKKNNYEYAITTIHPNNHYSINNVVEDNFNFHKLLDFSRGKRNVYYKKL